MENHFLANGSLDGITVYEFGEILDCCRPWQRTIAQGSGYDGDSGRHAFAGHGLGCVLYGLGDWIYRAVCLIDLEYT